MTRRQHLDQAIAELRAVADPYARLREADRLDGALVSARSVIARIKKDTVNEMRSPVTGYGTIAQRLGLTKSRVQQIATAPARPALAAYAIRDESGQWHGQPGLLGSRPYKEAPTAIPFSPADEDNPLAGQNLTVRYGEVPSDDKVSLYTVQIRRDDGSPLNLRMTHPVQDALFGPPILGTPERQQWEMARARRRAKRESGA
jgi:hypothetical protein